MTNRTQVWLNVSDQGMTRAEYEEFIDRLEETKAEDEAIERWSVFRDGVKMNESLLNLDEALKLADSLRAIVCSEVKINDEDDMSTRNKKKYNAWHRVQVRKTS